MENQIELLTSVQISTKGNIIHRMLRIPLSCAWSNSFLSSRIMILELMKPKQTVECQELLEEG